MFIYLYNYINITQYKRFTNKLSGTREKVICVLIVKGHVVEISHWSCWLTKQPLMNVFNLLTYLEIRK